MKRVTRAYMWFTLVMILAVMNVSCGEVYDYTPAGVSHNTDRFGKSAGKIDNEIDKSLKKMTDRFNLIVKRYLGLKISKAIAAMLDRSNLEQEDLDLLLDEGKVSGEDRAMIMKEYHLLMAASRADEESEKAPNPDEQPEPQELEPEQPEIQKP